MISRISLVVLLSLALAVPAAFPQQAPLQKVMINYPARSGGSWPLFIAKEGGYYQKYGLDVTLEFGAGNLGVAQIQSGEAVMTNSSMEQALQASSRSPTELVSMGSFLNKGVFALMASKNIGSIKDLKGKRIAVAQIGDAVYNYTIAFLSSAGIGARDVHGSPSATTPPREAPLFSPIGRTPRCSRRHPISVWKSWGSRTLATWPIARTSTRRPSTSSSARP